MLNSQDWDGLIPHVLRGGANPDVAIPRLRQYAALLIDWNRRVSNLISKNDEPRLVERHVLESIEPSHWLLESESERWLDFGSGAGFPALPLALIGIGKHWTLVESRRPKALFLRKTVAELKIDNVEIVHGRLEVALDQFGDSPSFHAFTSRATIAAPPTLALAGKLVRAGGTAFLWKGSKREQELRESPGWMKEWDFDGLLGIGDGRTAVCRFKKTR